MANLSDYTGANPSFEGISVISRFVTEAEYEAISLVSDPLGTVVPTDANFDEFFDHTLYYIRE